MTSTKKIGPVVMRRVYYSYALSILESSEFWQGALLGTCIALFGRLTHVAKIIDNVWSLPFANMPEYVVKSFLYAATHGELLTALVVLLMVGLTLSFLHKAIRVMQQYSAHLVIAR